MHRALIAIVAALVLPATASATTYCVKNLACEQAGGTHADDVQVALNAAAQNAGHDDVSLGAGTFVGNFSSVDPAGVTISGIPGKTIMQTSLFGPPTYPFVLALDGPGRGTGLRVSLGSAEGAKGISLAGGAEADAIDIGGTGVDQSAAQLDDATLSDSTIDVAADDTIGVSVIGGGGTLERDAITAYSSVSAMGADGSTTRLHALRLRPLYAALDVASGDVQVTDSILDLHTLTSGRAIYVGPGPGGEAEVDARNITIAGSGSAAQVGAVASLYGSGKSASIRMRDSVLYGLGTPV